MDQSRKSPTILVLSANLFLSIILGLAILNGAKPGAKAQGAKAKSTESVIQSEAKSVFTAAAANVESKASKNASSTGAGSTEVQSTATNASDTNAAVIRPAPNKAVSANRPLRMAYLPVSELPPPPPEAPAMAPAPSYTYAAAPFQTRSQKSASIKFTGIIGNKAVLSLRRPGYRKKYDTICLAPGEEARAPDDTLIAVQDVEPDRVTLVIGGKKIVQNLPHIH